MHGRRAPLGTLAAAAVSGAVLVSSIVRGSEQEGAPPAVYTAEQAAEGRLAYARHCASCHMPDLTGANDVPPLARGTFLRTWGTRTTREFLEYASSTMPPGGPSLPAGTYAAIVAHVLKTNGAPAGTQVLTAETEVAIGTLRTPPARGAPEREGSAAPDRPSAAEP